jgi:hypothetical protein
MKRDLEYVETYLKDATRAELLSKRQHSELDTIRKLYEQQNYMYETKTHSVPVVRQIKSTTISHFILSRIA